MSRRIVSVLVAGLMIFSLLPASAAFAQANATARLTGNQVVFPGDTTYTIEVTNTEPQLIGRSINAVVIYLPVVSAGIVMNGAPPAAGGFTATPTNLGGTQYITYKGGSIAPGASQQFTIPATVKRPARSDLDGDFLVKVSSNNFTTNQNAQPASETAMTANVEVLEILQGSLRPIAPTNADNTKGVTDGSGTGGAAGENGQTITYAFDVKNYAREDINVAGSLTANNELEQPGAPVTQTVAGNDGTANFNVPVTLGPAPTGNRSVQFSAEAEGPAADAAPKTSNFTVQQPVDIDFTGLTPTRVRSGFGTAREFDVTAAKTGGPSFELTDGALEFGSNVATLKNAPVTFQSGNRSTNLEYQIQEISGSDGDLTASITSIGSDDNLAEYNLLADVGIITIDNIVPTFEIDLPILGDNGADADGDELVAATNGTEITVNGKAFGTDLDADTLKVVLTPDVGDPITVPVSQSQEADGIRFTGSVAPDWAEGATRFVVSAEIADEATNVGYGQSSFTIIDLFDPVLDPESGRVQAAREIRVQFDDATGLRGACETSTWRIDGQPNRVERVLTSARVDCTNDEAAARELSADGVRILVLTSDLSEDDEPEVTYTPGLSAGTSRSLGVYLAKDGAQNDAVEQTITAVTDLVPPAPDLSNVRRRDHETGELEPATSDNDRYFTNNPGEQAIRLGVSGVKDGYTIQVLDGNTVVHEEQSTAPPLLDMDGEWIQDIDIPLPQADGAYTRGIRLVSRVGNEGNITTITFVVDTVLPTIGSSVLTAPDEVLAYFSEKIVDPPDDQAESSEDWLVAWWMQGEDSSELVRTHVKTVTNIDQTTRRFGLDFEVTPDDFSHVDYLRTTNLRYEDRAGNYLLDTVQPM